MADLLIVGSFAYDTINTPTARRERILGGTGSHATYGASFFTKVYASGIVGALDWRPEDSEILSAHNIDLENLQIEPNAKTSFWEAQYSQDMNHRETLEFQANCLADLRLNLSDSARQCPYIFLANNPPTVQMEAIAQCVEPKLIVADTMDYYINGYNDDLLKMLRQVDGLILNDSEAQLLTKKQDLFEAGDIIRQMGPRFVVIKKGAHGCIFMGEDDHLCVLPAYPSRQVVEPTGAGDCFAGAFVGYLASKDCANLETIKEALVYATVAASFTIEDFSFDALRRSSREDLDARYQFMKRMLTF
ncbi:MAG: PfkB family carbohydrate kinase [Planctomycetia bacterium]|nr:PfkB family carbohydrate kinase [Planctomycetia bacterium]